MAANRLRVIQVLEATVGGTRHYLLDLASSLPSDQFQQHIIVSALRDARFLQDIERMRSAGLEVTEVPMRRNISPISDFECMRQIRRVIRQWRPHIVHSHSSKAGFLARIAARSLNCANLYSPHCFAFQMRFSSPRRALYTRLERFAARYTDLFVLASETDRQEAIAHGVATPDNTVIIPTGIRAADYRSQADVEDLRRALGISDFDAVIGTVAVLTPQKGHRYLLEAFARLSGNPVLLLAGDGPEHDKLISQADSLGIADRVKFLGRRDDVPDLLAALDVFVLPSLWESLPYVLLEAMAAEVPIVATDVPGTAGLIGADTHGWLAPPADAAGLADTVQRALTNPRAAAEKASAASRFVETHHSLDNMIAQYVELYQQAGAPYRE